MRILSSIAIAASLLLSVSSANASALERRSYMSKNMICYKWEGSIIPKSCIKFVPDKATMLKRVRYPGAIVITQRSYADPIMKGWSKEGDCLRAASRFFFHDDRIREAKFFYCVLNQRGLNVAKPTFIEDYRLKESF